MVQLPGAGSARGVSQGGGDFAGPGADLGPVPGVADQLVEFGAAGQACGDRVGLELTGEGLDRSGLDEAGQSGDVGWDGLVLVLARTDRAAVEEPDRTVAELPLVVAEEADSLGAPAAPCRSRCRR